MELMQQDIKELLRKAGGAWGWLFAFGLIAIGAGICMFFFTRQALYVIAITFGVWLVVYGVFRFVHAFSVPDESGGLRALYALLSAAAVAAGVYLISHPVLSILVLTLTVGFFWIFAGVMELSLGIEMKDAPHRGWLIAGGALGILAGWIIIFYPSISVLTLALLLGFWLVFYGASAVVASLRLRQATQPARAMLRPQQTAT